MVRSAEPCVKGAAEGGLEIGDQSRAAARGVVGHRRSRPVGRDPGQEGCARRVVGDQLAFDRDVLLGEEGGQLPDVVIEARQLDHQAAAVLRQNEHLVVDQVAGLIGVQRDAVLSINIHMPLVQLYRTICDFFHDFVPPTFISTGILHSLVVGPIIPRFVPFVK